VAAQHAHWWESELSGYPPENIIVQPENRGTAAGILLPELWIARRSDSATVVILPSDHYVGREEILHESLCRAVSAVTRGDAPVVMLGVRPCGPEEEYGWIVPCPGPDNCPHRVASFREKPDACTAASLLDRGGLLNTFIIVGDSRCMLDLFQQKTPDLWRRFERVVECGAAGSWPPEGLNDLYRSIPSLDFSKDVLEESAEQLWVCPVPPCGWTDLGTPRRLHEHMVQSAGSAPELGIEAAAG
jgi:mannose-1-phosphate guanylyltransferase